MFMLALLVIWLPSQCSYDAMQFPQENVVDLDKEPFVDQSNDLEIRRDGRWYLRKSNELYSGIGVTFHPNGQKKTRTKFIEGVATGLIEEWDANSTSIGPRFKGEFAP